MNKKIIYVSDSANWVIKEIGNSLQNHLKEKNFVIKEKVGFFDTGIRHYSTKYNLKKLVFPNLFGKNILTYFHGDDSEVSFLRKLKLLQRNIDKIHTSCEITKDHLISNGIHKDRIVVIPIGIDVSDFRAIDANSQLKIKKELKLPLDKYIIGSFQKDGVGWGEGMEPKSCKGPDLFCDTVININKSTPVHILLTGPSRGYVKKRLSEANISFTHNHVENYKEISTYFNALDLYIVSSRLEGGPRAPMECMASGVPCISTKVGQVPELIEHGKNGFITEIGDIDAATRFALQLKSDQTLRSEIIKNGLKSVKLFDYSLISKQYFEKLYK